MFFIIPEQFTVKAHPALFEGEGGEPELRHYIFQSTTDIHIQNAPKTLFQSTVDIHFQNIKKLRRLALCAFI